MAQKLLKELKRVEEYTFKEIIYEKKYFEHGGVAKISINRPHRMNAVTEITIREICEAFSDASHDHTIGVVVFTGVGDKAFCAGGDVDWEQAGGLRQQFEHPMSINRAIRLCRKPVIAAVKGYAIGGGNHYAYFCDLTITADNGVFGQNGPRVGSPADGLLVSYLNRVVGAKKAKEIWMLCRRYTAQEAFEMGLVNKVVPLSQLEEEVDKWCKEILALSPTCLEVIKASFNTDTDYLVYSSHYLTHWLYPDYLGSEESLEGMRAFREKRQPDFGKFRMEHASGERVINEKND